MVVPWSDKKAVGRLDGLQAARRVRANGPNQIPGRKWVEVGKAIAAHEFCNWLSWPVNQGFSSPAAFIM